METYLKGEKMTHEERAKKAIELLEYKEAEFKLLQDKYKDARQSWYDRELLLVNLINKYRPYYFASETALASEIRVLQGLNP